MIPMAKVYLDFLGYFFGAYSLEKHHQMDTKNDALEKAAPLNKNYGY